MFIKDMLKFTVLENLQEVDFEALWIKILPSRLLRGYNSNVVGTIYHPPRSNDQAMREYLIRCLLYIESHYCNCGVVIAGNFNRLETTRLQNSFKLKPIVNFPTQGVATLDLILTNINDFYDSPIKCPPLGLSDHLSIELQPRERCTINRTKIKIKSRDLRPSKQAATATYLQQVDVCSLIGPVDSCQEKVLLLQEIIITGLDTILPIRSLTVHSIEPPWITSTLKELIRKRQITLSRSNVCEFRKLRSRVNRERKKMPCQIFSSKSGKLKKMQAFYMVEQS